MTLRYLFKPYKTKEEEEEYRKGFKETRLAHIRTQGRQAGKGIRPKGSGINFGFKEGFGKLVEIGANVQRNIEREQNFGFGGFGMEPERRKSPARHHKQQYKYVRVRVKR